MMGFAVQQSPMMCARPRVLLTAVGAMLACFGMVGCKVDQAKEVATYRKVVDAPAPEFVIGQPISLEDALALANIHNERINLQGEQYLLALIAKDRAAAAFMPKVNFVPTHLKSEGGSDQTDVPVNGNMNVFRGFSDVAIYRSVERTIEQRRALLLDAQAVVLLDVSRTYYQILRAERSVEVLKNSLVVQEERLRDTRGRQRAGVARPLDVAQTEAQVAATRVSMLAAVNDVATGRSVLAFLIGVPVESSPLVDDARVPDSVSSMQDMREEALRQRQDLLATLAAIEAARQGVTAAIGQYYPSVNINVNYFLSRQSVPADSEWNALLSANLPIFTGGVIHADVRAAWSQLRQAMLVESQTRRQVLQEVEITWQNLLLSRQRYSEATVQVTAAAEALRQAEESYKAGLATNLDRLTAQDALLNAQLRQTDERFNRKVSYLSLLRAVGVLSTRLPGEAKATTQPTTIPATQPSR